MEKIIELVNKMVLANALDEQDNFYRASNALFREMKKLKGASGRTFEVFMKIRSAVLSGKCIRQEREALLRYVWVSAEQS